MNEPQEEHSPPLRDLTKRADSQNGLTFLWLILLVFFLFIATPLPSFIASQLPKSWVEKALSPYYQETIIFEDPHRFHQPERIPLSSPLAALGSETGLCFKFPEKSDPQIENYIPTQSIAKGYQQTPLAEIIGVGAFDKEYSFDQAISVDIQEGHLGKALQICQVFGTEANPPKEVNALYIRPLIPFTALETVWRSANTRTFP